MKVSIVLPARNEGDEVKATVESMKAAGADEIIVVDDASEDGSCGAVSEDMLATFIFNTSPRAPSYCRNLGARAATGDVVVFADAHTRAKPGSLKEFALKAMENQGLCCACVQPLHSERNWTGYGGVLAPQEGGGYSCKYRVRPRTEIERLTGVIGAFYAFPQDVLWDKIGGWPTTISHGYNEQAISMACLFSDTPMVNWPGMVIQHMFKKRFNYTVRGSETHLNRFLVHYYFFDHDTFRDRWLPEFRNKLAHVYDRGLKLIQEPRFRKERDRIQALKKISDSQFFQIVEDGLKKAPDAKLEKNGKTK